MPKETLKEAGERASKAGRSAALRIKDAVRKSSSVEALSVLAGDIIRKDKRSLVGDPYTQELWKLKFWEGFMNQSEALRDGG